MFGKSRLVFHVDRFVAQKIFNVSCFYSDKGIVKYDDFGHVL